jgi:hypothetical protein
VIECDHGSDPATCPVCKPKKPTPRPRVMPYVFNARYGGYCEGCEKRIQVGDRIVMVIDESGVTTGAYAHEGCGDV